MHLSLPRTAEAAAAEVKRLRQILLDMPATAPSRYALAEIVLIRAAAILERSIAELAYKIACGAIFVNGNRDNILITCRSIQSARTIMLHDNGVRPIAKSNLKWTRASSINDSVSCIIDKNSHFVLSCQRYGSHIKEIFDVRNHAAHRNSSSRKKYHDWVVQQYGQDRNIQIGYFLLTTNLNPICNIDRYLTYCTIIIDEIVAGP